MRPLPPLSRLSGVSVRVSDADLGGIQVARAHHDRLLQLQHLCANLSRNANVPRGSLTNLEAAMKNSSGKPLPLRTRGPGSSYTSKETVALVPATFCFNAIRRLPSTAPLLTSQTPSSIKTRRSVVLLHAQGGPFCLSHGSWPPAGATLGLVHYALAQLHKVIQGEDAAPCCCVCGLAMS
jgi:hypothetical protein